jgi:hypothetical protein
MPQNPIPKWVWVASGVFIVGAVVLGAWAVGLTIKPDLKVPDVTKMLQTLSIIALLVERSIEVFLVAWRGEGAAVLESTVRSARRELADVRNAASFATASSALTTAESARDVDAAETRSIRLVAALVVGVLIAATGVRAFEIFFTQPPTDAFARAVFNSLNVLVTGGLIGGGSDVINKIIKVITETMDRTVDKLRGEQ